MDIIQEAKELIAHLEQNDNLQVADLISRLVDMVEWRDISSAKRIKGQLILGRKGGEVFLMQWGGFQDSKGVVKECWTDEKHEFPVYPDLWLPLPPVGDKQP